MQLFDIEEANKKNAPLPYRMSPQNLEEFVGQEHILGEGKLLRRAIEAEWLEIRDQALHIFT